MNKVLIITLSMLFSLTAFAAPFNGFYTGADVGGVRGKFNNDITTEAAFVAGGTPTQNISHNNQPSVSDSSWAGGLDLGLGKIFHQNFYLGIEAAGQLENIQNTNSFALSPTQATGINYSRQIQTKLENELGLTFNPGIILHKSTLLYGKIGPTWGRFSNHDTFNFNETIGPGQDLSGTINSNDGSSYQCGLSLGLGLEHYMTDHLSLRLEYVNTNYGTITSGKTRSTPMLLNGVADPSIAGSTISASDEINAHSNTIMLGINYHFNA